MKNMRGTLAMARRPDPHSASSQFFINVVDNTGLDWDKQPSMSKHPVFGMVIEGMDVADAISKVKTAERDRPAEAVVIEEVELLETLD